MELMDATDTGKSGHDTPNWRGRARRIDLALRFWGLDKHDKAKEGEDERESFEDMMSQIFESQDRARVQISSKAE